MARSNMPAADVVLDQLLRERILLLDGGMGTRLAQLAPGHASACDLLTLFDPELVSAVHHEYLEAGSDIIETNTFATASTADPGPAGGRAYEVGVSAARIARAAADAWTARTPDRPRFVAGVLGPPRLPAGGAEPGAERRPPDRLAATYSAQVRGLLDGGCDLLLVETIVDVRSAEIALAAIAAGGRRVPVMLSASLDAAGCLPSGEPLDALRALAARSRPFALGVNCVANPAHISHALEVLGGEAAWTSCHPSAGLPDRSGRYPSGAGDTAGLIAGLIERDLVNIVGGCCGTTPAHIRAVRGVVRREGHGVR